jgi:two-component system, NarL family, response regulator DevR
MEKINVMLVDVHAVVRMGLKLLLEDEKDIAVTCEADDAETALSLIAYCRVDVVVMDVRLSDKDGIEACREIRRHFPAVRVVLMLSSLDDVYLAGALRAGAAGFVLNTVGGDELLRAIRAANRGEMALDPQAAAHLISQYRSLEKRGTGQVFSDLSLRELDVLGCVIQGMTRRETGKQLNLSEVTVRHHLCHILGKLGLKNRTELAAFALKQHYKVK